MWDIDYWVDQMKSMMHTTPDVTLKLWDYAMNYVEATSAVKRSKKLLAELRTDAGLVGRPGRVQNRLQRGAVGLGEWGHALACVVGWGRCGC